MKQTAVEFAVEKLAKFIPSGNQLVIHIILERAKEMKKQQMKEMYLKGIENYDPTFRKQIRYDIRNNFRDVILYYSNINNNSNSNSFS